MHYGVAWIQVCRIAWLSSGEGAHREQETKLGKCAFVMASWRLYEHHFGQPSTISCTLFVKRSMNLCAAEFQTPCFAETPLI